MKCVLFPLSSLISTYPHIRILCTTSCDSHHDWHVDRMGFRQKRVRPDRFCHPLHHLPAPHPAHMNTCMLAYTHACGGSRGQPPRGGGGAARAPGGRGRKRRGPWHPPPLARAQHPPPVNHTTPATCQLPHCGDADSPR